MIKIMNNSILLTLIFIVSFLKADVITIATDEWYPYGCNPKSQSQGYLMDIVREIFEPLGHKVVYKTIPWSRAIALGKHGKITAILGALKDDAPSYIFPKTMQGMSKNSFCVRKELDWKYTSLESLEVIKLGVSKAYAYGKEIDSYINRYGMDENRIYSIPGDTPLELGFKLIKRERITALIEDDTVLRYNIEKQGLKKKFKIAGSIGSDSLYIAFSHKLEKSQEYANILDNGLKKLRKSGRLKIILEKYNLEDWGK